MSHAATNNVLSALKNNLKISVVIPMYNRKETISSCLDSIAMQSLSQNLFEVIVVDDGSTDGSVGVVGSYTKIKNLRLILLESNSGGASKPRNVGIDHAVADYIIFIDSDDTITKDALLLALKLASDGDLDMVAIPILFEGGRGAYTELFKKYPDGVARSSLKTDKKLGGMVFVNPGIVGRLYRSDLLKKSGVRFSEKMSIYEDTLFSRFVYSISNAFGMVDPKKAHYFPAVATGADNLSMLKRTIERCVLYVSEALVMCDQISDAVIGKRLKNRIINNALCRDGIYRTINNEDGYKALGAYVDLLIPYMNEGQIREKAKNLIRLVCRAKSMQGNVLRANAYFGASGPAYDLKGCYRKAWVWKERTLVIDFDFEGLQVGVNIDPEIEGYQSIELVLRGDAVNLRIDWARFGKQRGRHVQVFSQATAEGLSVALERIADILRSVRLEATVPEDVRCAEMHPRLTCG